MAGTGLLSGAASTDCAADSDGTSFTYTWVVDGQEHRVDSCERSIRADDPLARILDDLAARAAG